MSKFSYALHQKKFETIYTFTCGLRNKCCTLFETNIFIAIKENVINQLLVPLCLTEFSYETKINIT